MDGGTERERHKNKEGNQREATTMTMELYDVKVLMGNSDGRSEEQSRCVCEGVRVCV